MDYALCLAQCIKIQVVKPTVRERVFAHTQTMRNTLLTVLLTLLTLNVAAQGNNTGMGGDDEGYASLAERLANIEKKNRAFNVFIDYSADFQVNDKDDSWSSAFKNRQLRLEVKGDIGEHLYYRLRHRLNNDHKAQSEDNFAKATDIMMVGWKFNDKFSLQGGKVCQIWGGFEYDENPMFIYEYSEMVGNMDIFKAGAVASYKPIPSQELALGVSNTYNNKLYDEYREAPYSVEGSAEDLNGTGRRRLETASNPLTYIVNWNGSFLDNLINTRWSWGIQTQARHKYSRMLMLGQKLNTSHLQWYVDYMMEWDGLDALRIASSEISPDAYMSDVHYKSLVTKANWQFAPQWNLMLKGTYETASVSKIAQFKNYRKSATYLGSLEYYPVKDQNLRVSLSYIGRHVDYSSKSNLDDFDTNRFELGFMYRIKAF